LVTRLEQQPEPEQDERKVMTQPSTTRNTRQSGLRRPALALALGAATASTVLAPIAAMAVTAPTYNDSTKAAGSTVDKKPTLIPAGILTAMPATPMPAIVTGTSNGDVNKQALDAANASASVKASYATMVSKYNLWKTARTPVVTAYLAYKAAPAAQKAAKLKVYNTKLAAFNKAGGAAKYTAYKNAFTTYNAKFTPAFAAAKTTVKANHFKLVAGTYSGFGSTTGHQCSTADNMTSGELYAAELAAGVTNIFIGQSDGDQSTLATPGDTTSGLVIRCNTDQASPNFGRLEYYLIRGSGDQVPTWEYFSASVTVAGGKITGIPVTDTNATLDSLTRYTHEYITDHVALVNLATIPAAKKPDFNTYALNVLNKSGDFDPNLIYTPTTGKTCISANTGATLTCISFQKSLQKAITFAVKGMPY